MSLKKNISGGELDVPLLGRSVGDGEVVEVPDFQPAHSEENPLPIVWPPDKWQNAEGDGYDGDDSGFLPHVPAASDTSTEGM